MAQSRIALAALLVLTIAIRCGATGICEQSFDAPHYGIAGHVTLKLTVISACRIPGKFLPAAFIVNGALCRAASYTWLAQYLAQRGFAVIISEYTSHSRSTIPDDTLSKIDDSIKRGFDCPVNGTLSTVASFHSMVRFTERQQLADVNNALVIGHSFGGFIASASFYHVCTPERYGSFVCEYEDGAKDLPYRALVLALYEGGSEQVVAEVNQPLGTLLVKLASVYSRFGFPHSVGKPRIIDVVFDGGMNHFAVNNYAPAFHQSRINCASVDYNVNFTTTPHRQRANVRTIADVVTLAYYTYRYGGDREVRGIANQLQGFSFVEQALA